MKTKRVQTVQKRVNRFPYRYEAIDDAYARFLADGTLPADNALAGRVLHRVLHARKPRPPYPEDVGLYQPYGTTREMLFREACCDDKVIREFARWLLTIVVQAGHDPTDPDLIGPEMEPWEYAPVCVRLMGWPDHLVRPQYHQQLERLLQRQANERASRQRGEEWDRGAAKALAAFTSRGEVPSDPRYFAYVMGIAEQLALMAHYFGKLGDHGEELLAAFDIIATATVDERAGALQRVGALQVQTKDWRSKEAG
jgi:hypothetical protein